MTIQGIQAEVETLSLEDRRRLAAFLVTLRHRDLAVYRNRMAEKIDDTDPGNWLTLEELDERLAR